MLDLVPLASTERDGHRYDAYELQSTASLVDEVAATVREMYLDEVALVTDLQIAAEGLDDVCDEDELRSIVDDLADKVIPQQHPPNSKMPSHLRVPRNEVAEILAVLVLREVHGFVVPAERIKHKEVPHLPVRGLDVLGFGTGHAMVITEVKATSSGDSPPPVVDSGSQSMRAETLRRLSDPRATSAELAWAYKHAYNEHRTLVATAILLNSRSRLPDPIIAPVLVRPHAGFRENDFGSFQDSPQGFAPSQIRFVVVELPTTLEEFASSVYERAARGAA